MRKGSVFTFIELLMVIALLAIIAGLFMPRLSGAREKSPRINCAGNLKQFGLALRMYSADNAETLPAASNASGLNFLVQKRYLTDMRVYACPSTKTKPSETATLDNAHLDYIYKGGYTTSNCGIATGLACDRIVTPNHTNFGNVLFGDGHVKGFAGPNWAFKDATHNTGGWPPDPHGTARRHRHPPSGSPRSVGSV